MSEPRTFRYLGAHSHASPPAHHRVTHLPDTHGVNARGANIIIEYKAQASAIAQPITCICGAEAGHASAMQEPCAAMVVRVENNNTTCIGFA